MRILAARFHFLPSDETPLIVGYIVWDTSNPSVQPKVYPAFPARRREEPTEIMSTLRRLIDQRGKDVFHQLQKIRNPCWSFIDVSRGSSVGAESVPGLTYRATAVGE